MKKFADVILPLPLHSCFTYSLPDEWADEVQTGCRVVVPFGRKKYYTAIVRNVHYCAPTEYEVKEVSALLDARPILLPRQFSSGMALRLLSLHARRRLQSCLTLLA